MTEKDLSVKCEVNDKNKAAIKRSLSNALGINYSLWQGDSFEGKATDGKNTFKIKIDEGVASNGYKIHVSFEETGLGIVFEVIRCTVLLGGTYFLGIKLLPKMLGFLIRSLDVNPQTILLVDGKGEPTIICIGLVIALIVVAYRIVNSLLKENGWLDSKKAVLKKIDSVAKELNL